MAVEPTKQTGTGFRCRVSASTVLGVVVCAGLLVLFGVVSRQPHSESVLFEGRSIDSWLDSGYEDASRAVHEIGPSAVPAIFSKLRHEHPREGYWARYRKLWQKTPSWCRQYLPRPRTVCFDEWRACNFLTAIGPAAVPAIAPALQDRSALVRSTAAQALAYRARRGANIDIALPALRRALRDREPEVRKHAAEALRLVRQVAVVVGCCNSEPA